jgi:putative acetyltransferase
MRRETLPPRSNGLTIGNEAVMLQIVAATSEDHIGQAQELFREYGTTPGVVPCLEDFDREVASLPGLYSPPGGTLLLAVEDNLEAAAPAAGCVALRRWDEHSCEMKRLYVRPAFRGSGAGRSLVRELIAAAQTMGYGRMLLDTLPSMQEAHALYRSLGFREIPPYPQKPIPGALCFELSLGRTAQHLPPLR